MRRPEKRTVDLAAEVRALEDALAAALLLVELAAHDQFETEEQACRAPAATAAMLRLLDYRLHHIARVLRGDLDPGAIWSPVNDGIGGQGIVQLQAWDDPASKRKR